MTGVKQRSFSLICGLYCLLTGILIVSLAGYYFYVEEQKAQYSRYFLRQLSTTGSNIRETIEGIRTNLENSISTTADYRGTKDYIDKYPGIEKKRVGYIEEQLELIPFLESGSFDPGSIPTRLLTVSEKVELKVEVNFELIRSKDKYFLKALVGYRCGKNIFTVNVGLEKLVIPLLPEDVFENFDGGIVMARKDDENVLLETGLNLQLISLPKADPKAAKETGNEENQENPADENISGFSPVRDVDIGHTRYKLFLHPFRLPIRPTDEQPEITGCVNDGKQAEEEWLVGALIPQSTFRTKAMIIPPTLALVIFCILLVGILVLPFLRIRLIGLREGLKSRDALVLTGALLMGCSLVSLVIIHLLTKNAEEARSDGHLEEIAGTIGERFRTEMSRLEKELIRRIEVPHEEVRKGHILNDPKWEWEYPVFEILVGLDSRGTQQWKWSIRTRTTPMGSFSQREYFQRANNYELGHFNAIERNDTGSSTDAILPGRFIQSIRSKNTGEAYAMLTVRKRGPPEQESDPVVFGIQAMPLSLINPVLPPGYGFALIDRDGNVQFHSSSNRNLRENFFMETMPRWRVEALVDSGKSSYIDMEYRSKECRFYIKPFQGTPWTLIVFQDKTHLNYLRMEVISFTLALYGLYLLALILSSVGFYFLFRNKPHPGETLRMWFWPDRARVFEYLLLIVLMVFFTGLWYVCYLFSLSELAVLVCFVHPLVLLGILQWILSRKVRGEQPEGIIKKANLRYTYIAAMFGLFVCVAILPPVGFYCAVHKEEVETFTKYQQYELAHSLIRRSQRHRAHFEKVHLTEKSRNKLKGIISQERPLSDDQTATGIVDWVDVYPLNSTIRIFNKAEDPYQGNNLFRSRQRLIAGLNRSPLLPDYNRLSVITRRFSDPGGESFEGLEYGAEWRIDSSTGQLKLILENHLQPLMLGDLSGYVIQDDALQPMHVCIATPLDSDEEISTPWTVFCTLFGTVALLWMIATIMRILFIVDLKQPLSVEGRNLIRDGDLKKQIHIRLLLEKPRSSDNGLIITPQRIREARSAEELLFISRITPRRDIILDQFDWGLDEPDIALKKLELLEGLSLMKEKKVVLKTSIDPLFFLISRAQDYGRDEAEMESLLTRWSSVLQKFAKLRWSATENEYPKLRNDFMKKELEKIKKFQDLPTAVRDALADEGWPNRLLKEFIKKLCIQKELKDYTPESVVDQVRDLADAHYRKIWLSCSTDEKLLLYGLAQEGFANWRMKNPLRSLVRRRIVVIAPNFRLMNESFRQFVLNAEHPRVFQGWQDVAGTSVWTRIRMPIVLFGIALGAFFLITQREALSQSIRILSALAAGIPILFKAIGNLLPNRKTSILNE